MKRKVRVTLLSLSRGHLALARCVHAEKPLQEPGPVPQQTRAGGHAHRLPPAPQPCSHPCRPTTSVTALGSKGPGLRTLLCEPQENHSLGLSFLSRKTKELGEMLYE